MSEKRVYQNKMLNSKKEIIVCNWERGDGKTYSILSKIIKTEEKCLYISNNYMILQNDLLNYYEGKRPEIQNFKNKTIVKCEDVLLFEIYYSDLNSIDNIRGLKNIKYAFFDECYPSEEILKIIRPMGVEQIYIMITHDNMEYIDSRNSKKIENFYDNQIEELMIEYSNILKNEKTTLTRENILKQIKMLKEMKNN